MLQSSITEPRLHITFLTSPSLTASAINFSDNALTAFIPTPLRPTDFLNTFESYLAPVFIFVTQSKVYLVEYLCHNLGLQPSVETFIWILLPWPITNSSIELSITSLRKHIFHHREMSHLQVCLYTYLAVFLCAHSNLRTLYLILCNYYVYSFITFFIIISNEALGCS